jgi:hypothetical protein
MDGGQLTAIIIVAIVMFASIIRAKYGHSRRRDRQFAAPQDSAETLRLREEVKILKDRLHVLERITVDKENSLSREIDSLRDR